MRTILHISDIHFGKLDAALLRPLREAAIAVKPDLTVVSGDITQRARAWQFKEAAHFLESLPGPRVVVPGNHDVPMYNVPVRFLAPLWGYRRHIDKDPEPLYKDDELTVLGLNSARSLTIQDGSLDGEQLARMRSTFCSAGNTTRILVCHHPFQVHADSDKDPIDNADEAFAALAACHGDAVLTGHLHASSTECRTITTPDKQWGVVLIQAGTISMRTRGEAGAFNLIRVEKDRMSIDRYLWNADGQAFAISLAETFTKGPHGWTCH